MSRSDQPLEHAGATAEEHQLDVRELAGPRKHQAIFGQFAELAVGESFVLVNDHDPRRLHDEFDREQAGAYDWEYLERGPQTWRLRITRLASSSLPRVLVSMRSLDAATEPDATGAIWKLPMATRDLDSNLISLRPGGSIAEHTGPELDVLLHVVAGSGAVLTERGEVALHPGDVVWLPRRSRRAFSAGDNGLRYLTVHQRRPGLQISSAPPRSSH